MRRIIDERGRIFGRISVIDIAVVVVAFVIVVAFYTKFNTGDTPLSSRGTIEVTYTVRIAAIRLSSANLLRVGDKMYSQDTGAHIGTIESIEVTDAIAADTLVDGSFAIGRVEERYDVTLTVVAYCSMSNDRLYVDRTFELRANAVYQLFTKYNEFFSCLVTSISY